MRHLALALALLGLVTAAPSAEAPHEDPAPRSRRQRTEIGSITTNPSSSSTTSSSHLDLLSTSHLPAPPPPPPPRRLPPEEDATTDLSAALRDLARRKRQASGHSHRPYSSPLRSISGIHRYRYPLYRKRSYSPVQDYDAFEDEFQPPVLDPALSDDYDVEEEEEDYQRPSLFRERTVKRASSFRENSLENNDGAFSEIPVPSSNLLSSASYGEPMVKKDSVYNLAHAPYDLHAMGRLYEVGKRSGGGNLNSSPYKLDSLAHMYSTGKRDSGNLVTSPYQLDTLARMYNAGKRSVNPSGTEQFQDVISALRKRKLEEAIGDSIRTSKRPYSSDAEEYERLRDFFESAAGNYMRRSAGISDSLVRRRRDVGRKGENTGVSSGSSNTTNASHRPQQQHKPPAKMTILPTVGATTSHETVAKSSSHNPAPPAGDRQKRAFSDYFQWNRRKKSVPAADAKGDLEKREDYDDFLTREYFKTIARSVGNKKRMAYAQFEAKKRSVGVEEILESPTMLQYMQEKLKDAEDSTVEEAKELLTEKSDEATVSAVIARLDALKRMSEALQQLKELEEGKEVDQKRKRMSPAMVNSAMQERRKKQVEDKKRTAAAKEEEEEKRRKRKNGGGGEQKKRGEGYPLEFLGDAPEEECPVLDRVVVNCNGVSEIVRDIDRVFFSACNRHEVCYMCGSSLGVTGHECDALLSSALEASCGGQRDCLGAAAEAFNLLSDHERYDEEGTCTHDPCIRRYLESR